ncbi:unnamed protein product [Schistocephalus solidus]|uniref:Protein kinase domain-containing protein n=1 Tax=Schistocephalus solidus TaxID=70667 RepID=A0A183S858_SCHSO|nr:unnamed protein product [Schistocephalus solidus]
MLEHSNRSRDFEEINFIGGGAFSDVYSRHAREEVAVLSRLDHPNVVRYYTCWIETGCLPPSSSVSSLR